MKYCLQFLFEKVAKYLFLCVYVIFDAIELIGKIQKLIKSALLVLNQKFPEGRKLFRCSIGVYGHITLKTPVLVRSLKLSNVESSQYLDG